MKRSEINQIIRKAAGYLESRQWSLPEWAFWSLEDWRAHYADCRNILAYQLGWDITDFGSNNFYRRGLFLFTLRNGILDGAGPSYAEKIMIVEEEQETPLHFHWHKMEDIINRGGGVLLFNAYRATQEEGLSEEDLEIYMDDRRLRVKAGEQIALKPGQSLRLEPYVYHRFYGQKGEGTVLVGEVSKVNDDARDNRFFETVGRFADVEEDEAVLHYLLSDYERLQTELERA